MMTKTDRSQIDQPTVWVSTLKCQCKKINIVLRILQTGRFPMAPTHVTVSVNVCKTVYIYLFKQPRPIILNNVHFVDGYFER